VAVLVSSVLSLPLDDNGVFKFPAHIRLQQLVCCTAADETLEGCLLVGIGADGAVPFATISGIELQHCPALWWLSTTAVLWHCCV
jgi:hypothetical protein